MKVVLSYVLLQYLMIYTVTMLTATAIAIDCTRKIKVAAQQGISKT